MPSTDCKFVSLDFDCQDGKGLQLEKNRTNVYKLCSCVAEK